MKPKLMVVKSEDGTQHSKAIHVEIEDNSGNVFGNSEAKHSMFYTETGNPVPTANMAINDLTKAKSIKIDGVVIPLNPINRRQLSKMVNRLEDVTEYEFENASDTTIETIIGNEHYKEFEIATMESLGLTRGGGGSSDLYGTLKVYDGKKHVLIIGQAG